MSEKFFSGEVAFSQPVINIGSDEGNDIILDGTSVGDFHAMMHYESNRWYITPLDTSKKTMRNGLPITAKGSQLKSGDVLTIGDHSMTLMLNGINVDIFGQGQGNLSADGSQSNRESNIQLVLNGTPPVEVDAGGSVEYELTVSNTGPLVANMQLQLQGVPSSWVQITPPVVNLNEGQKGNFLVRVNPPRVSSAKAGVYYIHFVVSSPNYQRETAAVDISLTVHPYTEYLLNGPIPRVLKLSHSNSSDTAELVVINNSNAAANFIVQSFDDASELQFAYARGGSGGVYQNQEMVTVQAGENLRVPMVISPKKIPFIGFSSRSHHYSVNVTPSDRPGDAQSVMGEVIIKPLIRTYVLLLIIAVMLVGIVFGLQPYIHQFDGANGKHTVVVLNGNSAEINWHVSSFASKVTLNDGTEERDVSKIGSTFVSPKISTTYELKAENFLSRLLGMEYRKTIRVLSMPGRPTIRLLQADKQVALYNQPVKLTWAVEADADQVNMSVNKQATQLEPERYSGESSQGFTADTLVSLRAENASGYEMKSLFIHVAPDQINLTRFAVWVRPNGAAIPNNNDTTRTSRWSALQLSTGSDSNASKPSSVNPQPAAQSNTLEIPDSFSNPSASGQNFNPEQQSLNGSAAQPTPYIYTPPEIDSAGTELLVSPLLNRQDAQANPNGVQQTEIITSGPVQEPTAPQTSPEGSGNGYNRDFSIKFAEVVEDPANESGYRVIEYFPDYQIQPGEQILIEWRVEGVTQVKIDNLSSDNLKSSGGEYANPEKTTTYVLHAEVGEVKQDYSLPVRVAGEPEDGEGSGKNCELKASATTLKEPGTVMLSWTGAGGNRVQLVSSAKAESDAADAEKKKEQEAKEKGETYEKPKQPGPLSGGTIGDWLQPSGFMRINVENQTTFVLNVYDGGGNVICTKSVEVKLDGGNDKQDISKIEGASFKITRIADENNVEQKIYAVGQTVQYTVAFEGFPKDKEPSGNVVISDGNGSCTVTLPVTSCSFQAKKAGNLTVTAVYSGDNNYKKAQTTAKEVVIDKLESTTELQAALKPGANTADVITQLKFDTENTYGLIPTGTITFTAGSGTCDLDVVSDKLTCDGTVVENPEDGYWWTITDMLLADTNADRITAAYKGDNYFSPSTSRAVLFYKVPTTITIPDDPTPYKPDVTHANFTAELSWELPWDEEDSVYELVKDLKPTGTITFTPMSNAEDSNASNASTANCVYDIAAESLSCEGTVVNTDYSFAVSQMLVSNNADRVRVNYSGDSFYSASSFTKNFATILTTIEIGNDPMPTKYPDGKISLNVEIKPDPSGTVPEGKAITGKITLNSGAATACVYNIDQNTFENCSGDPVVRAADGKFEFSGLAFTGTTGNNITAEYSGDSYFRASTSQAVPFRVITKIDTQKTITTAFKTDASHVTVVSELTWTPDVDDDKVPTGTITYTIGAGTCVLDFSDLEEPKLTCEYDKDSDKQIISPVETEEAAKGKITFTIENMQIADQTADRITAAYSGDAAFNPSTSTQKMLTKVDTESIINYAFKPGESLANLESVLSWKPADLPEDAREIQPTGTITYTVGSGTCVLTLGEEPKLSCKTAEDGLNVDFSADTDKDALTVRIVEMLLADKTADRVTAAYSGDALFNPSTSTAFIFTKIHTNLKFVEAYKPFASITNIITSLILNEKDLESAKCSDKCPKPTGTITFTIIKPANLVTTSKTESKCVLTINENIGEYSLDCTGSVSSKLLDNGFSYEYTILNLLIQDQYADRIIAEYSGDSFYYASTASETLFNRVLTETVITEADKRTDNNRKLADFTVEVSWLDAAKDDATPTGTLTFTYGDGTCDIDMVTGEGVGEHACEVSRISKYGSRFVIEGMALGDEDPDSITAAYSGDSAFHPSTSQPWKFDMIDTVIEITGAFKPDDTMANLVALLTWDEEEAGDRNPTGTVTFIASNSMVDTVTCVHELGTEDPNNFSCRGTLTDNNYEFTIGNMPVGEISVDRIRVEYSGDDNFNPSTSKMVMFKTVGTATEITDAEKTADNVVEMTTVLSWDEFASGGVLPSGTIKFTSGSRTCTLVLSYKDGEDDFKFTDCQGHANRINKEIDDDKKLTISITGLTMTGAGETIKAEYSGSGAYLSSVSPEVHFNKFGTNLEIDSAKTFKTDSSHVTVESYLIWSKNEAGESNRPTGTVKFTIGSSVCTLDLGAKTLSDCESGKNPVVSDPENIADSENRRYHLVIEEVLFEGEADRVKAEYSGDSMFNASNASSLFKTLETETIIINDAAYKPYRPNEGYANFNVRLTWDETQSNGRIPGGTINFTPVNSETCVYTIGGRMSCEGTVTVVYVDPNDHSKGIDHFEVRNMLMSNSASDRIKAEYKGDGFFEPSASTTVLFDMSDTATKISSAAKSPEGVVEMIVAVVPTKGHPDGRGPLGTLKITSGTKTCTLELSETSQRFSDCDGVVTFTAGSYHITGLQMGAETSGNNIKAEYSGDSYFRASTSPTFDFTKHNTTITINNVVKPGDPQRANVTTTLSWDNEKTEGRMPTGTVTFTIGTEKCALNMAESTISCFDNLTKVTRTTSDTNDSYTWVIENIKLTVGTADRVYAEYGGDAYFNASASNTVLFKTVPTVTTAIKAFKTETDYADLSGSITWDESLSDGREPHGTVKITAGSGVCTLDIVEKKLSCNSEGVTVTTNDAKNRIDFVISRMLLDDKTADRVQMEYSGDGFFLPSSSEKVLFYTIPTDLAISNAVRTQTGVVGLTTVLSWMDASPTGRTPTGTIKFTSGTGICTLDISGAAPRFTDCGGSVSVAEQGLKRTYTITGMNMTGKAGDSIKAEYSGDGGFVTSTSNTLTFSRLNTTLEFDNNKTHKAGQSNLNLLADLGWDNVASGGQIPSGTVKFTIGSGVCTLNLDTGVMDCESENITITDSDGNRQINILKMLLADSSADRVKAEYSGDSVFNPSTATALFRTVETSIVIINDQNNKPYRPNDGYANFNTRLTWIESEADGQTPTGTITFTTIFPDPLASGKCVYDLSSNKMDCEGSVSYVTDHYEIRNMLMNIVNADRVKAEYSGDGFFLPSASTTVLFDMSDTSTRITSAAKSPDGVVEMIVAVNPTKDHPDNRGPLGTLKITSGTKTCTLELTANTQRFSDCEGEVSLTDENYHIIGLQMGAETSGNNIRAEYSGDSYFRPSTSPTYDFVKANTSLTITKAAKPGDPALADVTAVLSWRKDDAPTRSPSGNIRFTIGSDVCVLSRIENEAPGFNCTGNDTVITRVYSHEESDAEWTYTFTLKNILLSSGSADRVLAEYNGDALFNSSTSKTVLFKTVPTQIQVTNVVKTETDYADLIATLNWDETLADGQTPAGTLKITAGNGVCTLDIAEKKLSCYAKENPVVTVNDEKNQMTFTIRGMLLDDTSADRVQLEYSGDGFFLTSSSTKVLFDTIPTDIAISEASRTQGGSIDLKTTLSWINTSPTGRTPSGTIKFTSGTGTCNVEISGSTAKFKDCDGTVTAVLDAVNRTFALTITNMNMGTRTGEDIKAEYSGDGGFLPSVSETIAFDKSDTELTIVSASTYKVSDSLANVVADLTWEKEGEDDEQKASGTIKFTIGSGVCTLDLSAKTVSDCETSSVFVTETEDDTHKGYHVVITGLLLADNTADRVKAEYSGDSIFNPSSSTALFKTVETAIEVVNDITYKPYRPNNGYANFNTRLTWDESAANGRTPGGTITFTTIFPDPLVSTKCVYDLSTEKMDCEGQVSFVPESGEVPAHYEIRNMLMNYAKADRVKAEYSGDGFFLPSASTTVLFDMSDTATRISSAAKSPEGVVAMTVAIVPTKEHPDGREPLGTLKIISGTKTCTLELTATSQKFSDCDGVV